MNKSLPICAAITKKDGTRCGRRAAPEGLLCHIHQAKAEGRTVSALTEPTPFDAEAKLRKIAAKDGHPNQVQAIRMLLDRQQCSTCAARAAEAPDDFEDILRARTEPEKERMRELFADFKKFFDELNQIKDAIRARIRGQKQ